MATGEFKFPDEIEGQSEKEQDIEVSVQTDGDDVEIDIVDDTPERDRGRKPLDREVSDPTDEELDTYTEGVKKRLKELTHARHDERRAKEALAREKQELERLAMAMMEENKRLKQHVQSGTEQFQTMAEQAAEAKLEKARRELKAAQEAYDTDAIIAVPQCAVGTAAAVARAYAGGGLTDWFLPSRDELILLKQSKLGQVSGTQALYAEAPDIIIPELRPYRRRSDITTWARDRFIIPYVEDRLERYRYVAIGEFHVYGNYLMPLGFSTFKDLQFTIRSNQAAVLLQEGQGGPIIGAAMLDRVRGLLPAGTTIERAGAAVARAAVRMLGGSYGKRVVVIAGKGNNGNDGRSAARRLAARGGALF